MLNNIHVRYMQIMHVLLSPALKRKQGTLKLIRPSVCPSLCPSVCHKNSNLAHIFWSSNDGALIFGMHDPCDKHFQLTQCHDLDLWPFSNLLPHGGPQFSKFACFNNKHLFSTLKKQS